MLVHPLPNIGRHEQTLKDPDEKKESQQGIGSKGVLSELL